MRERAPRQLLRRGLTGSGSCALPGAANGRAASGSETGEEPRRAGPPPPAAHRQPSGLHGGTTAQSHSLGDVGDPSAPTHALGAEQGSGLGYGVGNEDGTGAWCVRLGRVLAWGLPRACAESRFPTNLLDLAAEKEEPTLRWEEPAWFSSATPVVGAG